MSSSPRAIRSFWYRWKSFKFPWRKRWLVGSDLTGNTYWEFKDALNQNRVRRIVKYNRHAHLGDVKLSPQWIQWLRHTRFEAPTITEQQHDEIRLHQIKLLAAEADKRWASKPSVLDAPEKQQPMLPLRPKDLAADAPQTEPEQKEGVISHVGSPDELKEHAEGKDIDHGRFKGKTKEKRKSPWKQQRGVPGDDWQPRAWTPGSSKRS
ncbi:hypothetical protein M501DRAFT_1002261 [Patellaria atrata CBS 101060]|uniref:NADH dehydrogenase [ubiquinone] 1 alpha subcomplex subunit n=1 Tax=Patellaria atrata CBS 101060 TaxID=1346257 RepID=A0A9P4SC77_9PEZI|nr:hypothetical protein M501DRAFT_1002261 [Patellaria atrata CBS 101060]